LDESPVTTVPTPAIATTYSWSWIGENYATREIETWGSRIDGKMIYKRTFSGTREVGGTANQIITLWSIENIERKIKIEGMYAKDGYGLKDLTPIGNIDQVNNTDYDCVRNAQGNWMIQIKFIRKNTYAQLYHVTVWYTKL
jgi:hypothetical protein